MILPESFEKEDAKGNKKNSQTFDTIEETDEESYDKNQNLIVMSDKNKRNGLDVNCCL